MFQSRLARLSFTSLLLLPAFLAGVSHGATRIVGKPNTNCPNPAYSTITEAVDAAMPRDEITICPALYPEQLVITKPLTLRGLAVNGIGRVRLAPAPVRPMPGLPIAAVISVVNTSDVTIQDLVIDASDNTVSGCDLQLAGIRFYNSSGAVRRNAIFGARLKNPQSCAPLFPGNGFGVQIDANRTGAFHVFVESNSIHDFTRNGVLAMGTGVTADITNNSISGLGPAAGSFQFGVFIASGAVGHVIANRISEGVCGSLSYDDCWDKRTEGIVLRNAGDDSVVLGNTITNAQNGIFINGAKNARITDNVIHNVDLLSGIHVQGMTYGLIADNHIYTVGPINADASINLEGCGINVISGAGNMGNTIMDNSVSDAYCGIAYVSADLLISGTYINTLYNTLNSDHHLEAYPPATEPRGSGVSTPELAPLTRGSTAAAARARISR